MQDCRGDPACEMRAPYLQTSLLLSSADPLDCMIQLAWAVIFLVFRSSRIGETRASARARGGAGGLLATLPAVVVGWRRVGVDLASSGMNIHENGRWGYKEDNVEGVDGAVVVTAATVDGVCGGRGKEIFTL